MPSFDPKQNSNSFYTPKEPNLNGSIENKNRGNKSSRNILPYNPNNKSTTSSSNPLIFGLGTSLKSNVGADLTTDSSKNKIVAQQNTGISQNTVEQIKEDSKQNINPDVTKSATAPEKVVQDIINKINKTEASYNYIPPTFETYLLQNSKNKILFNFIRPTFSYNLKILQPAQQSSAPQFISQISNEDEGLDQNINLIPIEPEKIKQLNIDDFSILFYKTKVKPSTIEEMTVESNLFKELIPSKKELSVIDFLDVNTDYYFYVSPGQGLTDKIKNLIVEEYDLSLNDFKIITAEEKGIATDYVYRIKIIKDGNLYFLEKEALNLKEVKDTKKTKSFFGTILAEVKYNFVDTTVKNFSKTNAVLPFTSGDSVFDSSQNHPYIKLRFKSKKSNRKIDLNLKYTTLNSNPVKLIENQIEQNEKYIKLKTKYIIAPTMFLGDTKYSNFLSSPDSRLSGIEFSEELKKIASSVIKNSNILVDSTKVEDFIIDPASQDTISLIKKQLNKESSIYKLFNKGTLIQEPAKLILDIDGFNNFDNNRVSGMTSVSLDNKKTFTNVPFYAKNELEIFKQAVESYYPNIFIEYDPNFKFLNEYKSMKIYNASIQDVISVVNNSFLKEIYYKYPDNVIESAKNNFLLLINNLKQEKETSMYMINKGSFMTFLASLDSREPKLLENFIKELNTFYSSDTSKSIVYVYDGKNDTLYDFLGYTKQDLNNFINEYPSENYLKIIYAKLVENIEIGKEMIVDAILQL